MAIDIRATVTCSLGTLISASISDDYVQGTGLIKCKGSCELSGIVTPDVGTAVTFSYTQDGVTRQVPRKLRVMSSFADPFRRTTKVELGCKLTYLQDLQEPVDWTPFDDILNNDFTVDDAKIVTIPIHASSVMDKCLDELGITADTNPLTNKFSIARFDFSPGYVNVLSDLLVSESYCAYLNKDEELKVFSLDEKGGTGPVIEAAQIIDLGSIGVGQLPGEAVVVSYSTLKLNPPDPGSTGTVNWEEEETVQVLQPKVVAYGTNQSRTFTGRQVTSTVTEYETISLATAVSTGSWFYWQSLEQFRDVVASRTTTVTSPSAYVEENRVVQLLNNGVAYANTDIVSSQTVETTTYAMTTAEPLRTETLRYEDRRVAYSRLGLQLVYSASDYVNPSGLVLVGKTVVEYERSGDFTKTVTSEYVWAPERQVGSQAVAEARDVFADATEVAAYLGSIDGVLVHAGTTVSTTQRGVTTYEGRPNGAERTNAANASGGDPNNGWRTESTAELELALGSATAQRRIEFSLPYAPDDTFTKAGSPPTYGSTASDAAEKASRYGRCQNRLLLGNRSGMNLQLEAKRMPSAPFKPIVVKANGLSALYRTNGTSWQMDASGILASTDALFWGAVGGTGDFWFPTAPGITTLPTEPAVVNGEMTVSAVVPVWNETVVAVAKTSTKLQVTSLPYALSLLTEVAVTTQTALVVTKILKVEVPAADVTVGGVAPAVSIGVALRPPAADVAVAGAAPAVSTATVVQVPAADVAVASVAPAVEASLTVVLVPVADITVAGATPDLQAGDDYYSNLATQFFTLLRDWRVDWWGD